MPPIAPGRLIGIGLNDPIIGRAGLFIFSGTIPPA
jgi:hypothetical protein